jgi:hypothetical protein
MKSIIKSVLIGLALLVSLSHRVQAQQDCEAEQNYSISNFTFNGSDASHIANDDNSSMITIGSPFTAAIGSANQGGSVVGGFFSYYNLEPQPPIVYASQGEYLDRIEIEWEIIDQRIGPWVTGTEASIYRNGRLYTTVPLKQTSFVDYNVFPGEFYSYEIVSSNESGDSRTLPVIGFLNPNGRITGTIETRLGTPVLDARVTLAPDLGRCLDFDGVGDYAYFSNEIIELNDYYTIEGWWRNVDVKDQTILTLLDSGNNTPIVKISLTENGTVQYYHDGNADGTGTTIESRLGYNLDAFSRDWHHFAVVNDTTNMYLYVDGRRVAETGFVEGMSEHMTLELAKNGKGIFSGYYSGQLDDLRFWNIGRTRADIRKYKDITLTGEETYLDSYWKFDEQFGEIIYDYVEKPVEERHHGYICDVDRSDLSSPAVLGAYTNDAGDYLIKGVYYGSGQTFAVNVDKGTSIGFSLKLDGEDDYISYHLDRLEFANEFTLEGWFKTGVSKDMTVYEVTDPENGEMLFSIEVNTAGNLVVNSAFGDAPANITTNESYNDEFWYHYAVSYGEGSLVLYVNSEEKGRVAAQDFEPILTRYVIGRSEPNDNIVGDQYFNGWIDEMRIWNYARTANQVSATQNQVIPSDEKGVVDPDGEIGVAAYWMFGEGQGSIITDATPHSHAGELKNAQIAMSDQDEIVTNWEGDDIPLQVEFFTHAFQPNSRNISLDPSVTAIDRIDFTDISQLAVSGFVRFSGTNCFTDSVEVLVNGQSSIPNILTDGSGKFSVEFEPGSRGQILTFEKADHTFVPGFIELPRLVRPISGIGIENTTTRKLKGVVVGGECHLPIGGADDIKVTVSTEPFCYGLTTSVDEFGNFEFPELPPQSYTVSITHSNTVIHEYFREVVGATRVNLLEQGDSIGFIYRAPLEVEIEGLEPEAGCDKTILAQYTRPSIRINVFENYYGGQCDQVSGTLTINDNISDLTQQELEYTNGSATYKLSVGVPNILEGGSFPFQKNIQIVAEDQFQRLGDDVVYAYVTGNKPRNVDFSTTSPEIPFLILRSPPGDGSFTYLEEGETFTNSMKLELASDLENEIYGELSLGGKVVTEAGTPFFSTQLDIETNKTTTGSLTYGSSMTSSTEMVQEISTSQTIATVPGQGDVYVGGAMNILYGITDVLKIEGCDVELSEDITFYPDGFETTFIYSEEFITGTVIPELDNIGDTDGADMWKQIIIMNHILKKRAKFQENISFDAGSVLSRSSTETVTSNLTYETSVFIEPSIGNSFGVEVNGNGFTAGKNTKMRVQMGQSSNSTLVRERTIGYELSDDDFGDNFTVNIKNDPVYGTPVFDLVSGASSCPYEGEVIDYANGLDAIALDPIIEDLGKDLLFAQASKLVADVGLDIVLDVVDEIDGILSEVGLNTGIGDVINEENIDEAISIIDETINGDDTPEGRFLDLVTSSFDYPGVQLKNVYREGVQLTVDKNSAINVPEDQPAIFNLSLGNTSETGEPTVYYLQLLNETNPGNAAIAVAGEAINAPIGFLLEPGKQIDISLTVSKGPESFSYEGIGIMLYSACEAEHAISRGINTPPAPFASIQYLDISFIEVCSPITIFNPGDDWVVTQANENKLNVTLTDYVADRTDFTEVKFQYRRKIEGQPWINAIEILKADLDPGATILSWDVKNLDDGIYEIRALTFCDAVPDPRSSEVLTGTLDRKAPALFGTPSPADAVLSPDDEISIVFDENIQCGNLFTLGIPVSLTQGEANNVALSNTETGLYMDATVTCEGNKLIIVPDIQNKFIEEQVIRVDVLGMTDELGNQQTEIITWEFLVRRNPLAWIGGDIQAIIYEGVSPEFVRSIKNNGAFGVNVNLSGALDVQTLTETSLPSWLTATPRSFQLQPGATQDVTFKVSDQIGGGEYIDMVTAATSFGAPELRFDVRVLCPEPVWEIDPALFENSMNFTGQLDIRGELSTDEFDYIAAFVGNELRGVGQVTYTPELENIPGEHPYLVFMTLYTNSSTDEMVEFQVWDASRCQLYGQVLESYEISLNTVALGTPTNPMGITVTNDVIQNVPLSKGWNWVSFNLYGNTTATNTILGSLDNSRSDIVKSREAFSQYVPGLGWVGPLAKMDSTQAFRIKMTNADTLVLVGSPIDFETTFIELEPGWNWVSFLPPVGMELNEALSSLNATADFIIKSQRNFAQYVDFQGWIGSLDFLRPNEGYLIYTDRAAKIEYPVNDANARAEDIPEEKIVLLPKGWNITEANYEFNGNLIMRTSGMEATAGDIIGLFDNDELVGYGEAKYLDFMNSYYFFITAFTNDHLEDLDIRLVRFDKEYTAKNDVSLAVSQVRGSVESPLFAQFEIEALAVLPSILKDVELYPNPVIGVSTLSIDLEEASNTTVTIHNLTGQVIHQIYNGRLLAGNHTFKIDKDAPQSKLSSGLYLIQVQTENKIQTLKILAK